MEISKLELFYVFLKILRIFLQFPCNFLASFISLHFPLQIAIFPFARKNPCMWKHCVESISDLCRVIRYKRRIVSTCLSRISGLDKIKLYQKCKSGNKWLEFTDRRLKIAQYTQHFEWLIEQECPNEHTCQGTEVMFGERYVYVYSLSVILRNLIIYELA
jgi:hypothetical protein